MLDVRHFVVGSQINEMKNETKSRKEEFKNQTKMMQNKQKVAKQK